MDGLQGVSDFLRQFWGLWLMLLFLGTVWWAYRPSNKRRFEDDAMIPLRDDDAVEE
ncbi:cbb3-type cytochrome oxidase subunit 3 [Roseospira visakhapatnamensis]|uniref:Cytochrome c oxidase cbb3-type subunit 4 n=1 Tax=Roseospira visakhapatnamensis TaxID=390880 RepID=A0A7W6RC49_9PROT|nr:cbb3-type cytochrome c oxidase subunit 3 [Roseospira visakhapatnamensis]MBB4265795.1 cytochrome c oxidase cbb3-type subunit 4 [Roseospira visakhapatnamensis]